MTTKNAETNSIFVQNLKTRIAMLYINKVYERFWRLVSERCPSGNPDAEFCTFCKSQRVSPVSMNALLEEELGMSGPEILYSFQKMLNLSLTQKH